MKSIYHITLVAAVVLSSCSVYRQGQTPDDVYYAPAREKTGVANARSNNDEYVDARSSRTDGRRYNNSQSYYGYDEYATPSDRWLMMRVRNPYRWSAFDDYMYYNSFTPYGFYSPFYSPYSSLAYGYGGFHTGWSFGLGFGSFYDPWGLSYSPFHSYWNWNSYYNPYYPGVVVVNPKLNPVAYNTARNLNLSSYSNRNDYNNRTGQLTPRYNNTNTQYLNRDGIRYNNSNSTLDGRRNGSTNRNNNYYSPSADRPVRSYNPSSNNSSNSTYSPRSSGSGSNSSGSGGGGGSRPSRR